MAVCGRKTSTIAELFENNRHWSRSMTRLNEHFFESLAEQQSPKFLWIGCSDSRVPANEIIGLLPGQIFVHRNVANLVIHTDMNCLSVLQYAVEILRVKHIIVCGHYGCGGVTAAVEDQRHGLIDNWLRHVRDVHQRHRRQLGRARNREALLRRLCELNAKEQVANVANTTTVQDAWRRGQRLAVHGWIYDIRDGLIKDLGVSLAGLVGATRRRRSAGQPTVAMRGSGRVAGGRRRGIKGEGSES